MKRKQFTEMKIRWAIGFVFGFLQFLFFLSMLGVIGAMEREAISIFYGVIGSTGFLLLWAVFFYATSLFLYDYEP